MSDWNRDHPIIVGGTLEENTRLINLLIGKLTWLETRQDVFSECITEIYTAAHDIQKALSKLQDALTDE